MGHNPRFRLWTRENWQGYCPTIDDMARRDWSLTAHCRVCNLAMAVDIQTLGRTMGWSWSPWGRSARCRRLHCCGRMWLRAYAPRAGEFVDI
ncbi:MAG: hypothetical protein EON90_13285 [Brevundimonas sp.]|nr:MAG: hypothetical protein EON90_13285 [Brevundimonas sp.]